MATETLTFSPACGCIKKTNTDSTDRQMVGMMILRIKYLGCLDNTNLISTIGNLSVVETLAFKETKLHTPLVE